MNWFKSWFSSPDKETLEKIDVLNEIKLFENARREDLVEVARECTFQPMEEGETVVHKGDPGDGMFIVDNGQVSVQIDDSTSPVATFGGGEYFGEMALIEEATRSADVVCDIEGRLLFFSKEGFYSVLRGHPSTASKFLFVLARTLSNRLRETNEKLKEQNDGES